MTAARALTRRIELMKRRRVLVSQHRRAAIAKVDTELVKVTTDLLAKATGFRRRRR